MKPRKQLVLGGIRSGKSRIAERLAIDTQRGIIYVATSEGRDDEMQQRIDQHKALRPASWTTIEEPIYLSQILQENNNRETCLLIECLTLWLTNLLMQENEKILTEEVNNLLETLPCLESDIIFVSNESGLGVVPLGEMTRRYCDEIGVLHQQLAQICDRVIFTVAGLPQTLKGSHYEI